MNIKDIAGITLGIKFVNGKIKPKFGIGAIIIIVFMFIIIISLLIGLIYGILTINIDTILICLLGIIAFGYLLLISPYTQNSKNYYIQFESQNTLAGLKLFYKNKLVSIKYIIDDTGKIAFANNSSKLSCISYADNSKMSNFTKYKIINYFTKWLSDNKLISDKITSTFEQI